MSSHVVASSDVSPAADPLSRAGRLFHAGVSVLLIALAVWGFRHFYLEGKSYPGREIPPPIRTLVIAHGVAMALWMLLLLVQTSLVATGRRRLHMALGKAGAALAAIIVVAGFLLGVESTRIAPPEARIWGLSPREFMAVPIVSIALFGAFAGVGIAYRRRPEFHRAAMLLATLAAMGAAVSRIDPISALYVGTVWERAFGPFFSTLVLAAFLVGAKSVLERRFDRILAGGWLVLTFAGWATMALARTGAWGAFADFLIG